MASTFRLATGIGETPAHVKVADLQRLKSLIYRMPGACRPYRPLRTTRMPTTYIRNVITKSSLLGHVYGRDAVRRRPIVQEPTGSGVGTRNVAGGAPGAAPPPDQGQLAVHPRRGRLRLGSPTEAVPRPTGMIAGHYPLLRRRRIASVGLSDAACIDALRPRHIQLGADGGGELGFGAPEAKVDWHWSSRGMHLTWDGSEGWITSAAMATPSSRMTKPSQARTASTAATRPPSQRGAGGFFGSLLVLLCHK